MNKFLLAAALFISSLVAAQTVHFPGKETNNIFTGTDQFTNGAQFGPIFFMNLPASTDGTIIYCPDCQITTPCLGGGTGAFAQRSNAIWGCATGAGGGITIPGGPNTGIQVNDNGVLNSFSPFTYNKVTSTITFPDLTAWSPTGLVAPNNALIKMDGNQSAAHFTGFTQPLTTGALELVVGSLTAPLQGGVVDLRGKDSTTGSYALIGTYDGSGHGVQSQHYAFQLGFDNLGFQMSHGWYNVVEDGGITGSQQLFLLDRVTRSAHFYGPIVLPNAAGTGFSYGVSGAALLSQGSATPAMWSNDVSGVFGLIGTFGSCAGVTPSGSQSAFCFGPAGHIQASWAGDAFSDLVRVNNIPATGITGLVEPSQIDLTGTGLGAIYQGLNAITQYNIPEGGASGAGLQAGPFNDAVDSIVTLLEPFDAGSQVIANDIANCASTGTTLHKLSKYSSTAGATCAVIASIADTQGEAGVCVGRCGTTGTAVIAHTGQTLLAMDGATTDNDWIINSPSVAGDGRDTGSTTCPTSGAQVIGRVLSTNGGAGNYNVQLGGCNTTGGGGGGGGTPGGASGQVQWNNGGAFAGLTISGDCTLVTSTGVMTCTGLNGTAFSGANGDLVSFGASNIPADSGILATNVVRKDAANTGGASMTLDMSAALSFTLPGAANPTPTTDGKIFQNTTDHTLRCGNGTTTTRCMVFPLPSACGGVGVNSSITSYTKIIGGASCGNNAESSVRQMLPFAGTVTNLCVTTTGSQSGTGSLVITFRDTTAGSNSALTTTFTASQGATANQCDTTHSATITAGHDYVIQLLNNASATSATIAGISAMYTY